MKCVVCGYNPVFESVKVMVEERYSSLPAFDDYLVVLAYNNESCNIDTIRQENPEMKIVVYQLEQLYENHSQWFNKNGNSTVRRRTAHIINVLESCDEIWDYSLDNIRFLEKLGFRNVKHVPVQYSERLNRKYDILFYGSVNDRRAKFLSKIVKYKLMIIAPMRDVIKYRDSNFGKFMIPSVFGDSLFDYVFKAKIVLNIHYYDSCIQEQVRIFDLLINDSVVLSEKSRKNYYPGLISEFENTDQMIVEINRLLNSTISERYRKSSLKRSYKVGAAYNTFYGLEFIEESIRSIRNIVDYIVVVHQRTGFNGESEPAINNEILNRIDAEIVYYAPDTDRHRGILEKRNIGLEYCKKNGCDYIIPFDTDEIYNEVELRDEIDNMYENNIDTLYAPIRSYYFDRDHYFDDTYFVPAVYKINDRVFQRVKSSVLCDPIRKMNEGNYRISKTPMHHYTYLIDSFDFKVKNSIMSQGGLSGNKKKIYEHLLSWKEGQMALVHKNKPGDGSLYLTLTPLKCRFKKEKPRVSLIVK